MRNRWRGVLRLGLLLPYALMWILTGIASAGTILEFTGKWWWHFELASHFRVQWLVLLVVALPMLLRAQRYKSAVLLAVLAALNLRTIVPFYLGAQPSRSTLHNARHLRIVSLNVRAENQQHEPILTLIRETSPDFVTLFEVNPGWEPAMRVLRHQLPHAQLVLRQGHFGLALLSRYPIQRSELKEFGTISVYAIVAHLTVDEQPLTIIGAHVLAPLRHGYWQLRNTHLADLARTARAQSGPVLLIGDLNVTPWSPYFRDLLRDAALRDGRKGFGVQPTWPVQWPLLRIPIDHCLASPSITIQRWTSGPRVGSDHFPIIVDFAMH